MLYIIYVKSKSGEKDLIIANSLVIVRLLFDYILLFAVFFENDYSKLYKRFCCKSFFYFSICLIIDILILFYNILVFNSQNKDYENNYSMCFYI